MCATSLEDFDSVMQELFDSTLSPLHKASLRLAWKRCQAATTPATGEMAVGALQPDGEAQTPVGSWSETFAPKLTSTNVSQIKAAFKRNYPAEVLLPENLLAFVCYPW